MKKTLFLVALFFVAVSISGLVNSRNLQTRNDSPTAFVTPPVNNESNTIVANDTLEKDKEVERILTVINSAKISSEEVKHLNQGYYREVNKVVKYLTQKSQLTDLKNVKLSENDKEIRIWKIETLFLGKTKGYIFTFINGQWQGLFIVDTGKKSHFKKIYFEEPLSGWQNWEVFVENEINLANIEKNSSQPFSTDGSDMVIEVKVGQKYEKSIFYNSNMDENKAGNILRKIKSEFYNDKIKWSEF